MKTQYLVACTHAGRITHRSFQTADCGSAAIETVRKYYAPKQPAGAHWRAVATTQREPRSDRHAALALIAQQS